MWHGSTNRQPAFITHNSDTLVMKLCQRCISIYFISNFTCPFWLLWLNSASRNHHLSHVYVYLCHSIQDSFNAHVCTYIPHISHQIFGIYGIFSTFRGIFFPGTLQLVVFWHIYTKMMGLYAHEVCWLFELYLECGSLFFWLMYVKYACSGPCYIVDASGFICGICMCIHPPYMHVKYLSCMA